MAFKPDPKPWVITTALIVFIGLPLLFYVTGDVPRRSLFKEALSILTVLSFMAVLGQPFLARSNETLLSLFKPLQIQRLHKLIAYCAVSVLLLHPFLIVLPRYFEAGIRPWDALITMLTNFESLGIILGLVGWVLLLVLAVTSIFRMALVRRFGIRYRSWRYFHGALSLGFLALALWHAIDLGRHTGWLQSLLMAGLVFAGGAPLLRLYWKANSLTGIPRTSASREGAKS